MSSHGRQILFKVHFPFLTLFDSFFTYVALFFGPQITIIFIYVVKLMYQPQWSMFRHGQCFGVLNVQMWVIFEVVKWSPPIVDILLMHRPQWSKFRHGQGFSVVKLQM